MPIKTCPKVSVIIPVYNGAKYIREAIQSVLDQSFKDFEIIVINDGSTDDTPEILSQFGNQIRNIHQDKKGVSAARNLAIAEARGEFVAFLDDDDIWLPDKLMKQVSIAELNPEVALFFSDVEFFDEKGWVSHSFRSFNTVKYGMESFRYKIANAGFNDGSVFKGNFYKDFLLGNMVTLSSVLVRLECLKKAGCFDVSLSISEDYDLWIRMARTHSLLCLNSVTTRYRFRDGSVSGKVSLRKYLYNASGGRVLEKQLRNCPKPYKDLVKNRVLECYRAAIWAYFNLKELKNVRALCLRSLHVDLLQLKLYIYLLASFLPARILRSRTPLKY